MLLFIDKDQRQKISWAMMIYEGSYCVYIDVVWGTLSMKMKGGTLHC
jgi:hypothetical protein